MKTNHTKRDAFDAFLLWTAGLSFVLLLLIAYVAAPAIYILAVGSMLCLGIVGLTLAIGGSLMSSGSFFDAVIGYQVLQGGFQLVGVLFMALASASSSD